MLEKSQIVKNAKKYFETAQSNGFMTTELMQFLGESFVSAPASTMKSLHNAFEGGLVDHLLTVAKFAVQYNNTHSDDFKVDQKSLLKVCFLHQIGKAFAYKPCESEWHRNNQGKMYDFVDDLVSMRIGERSLYYAINHGITFTEEEYIAILNFDKTDDKMSEYHNTLLGDLLKMSNHFAIKYEKIKYGNK